MVRQTWRDSPVSNRNRIARNIDFRVAGHRFECERVRQGVVISLGILNDGRRKKDIDRADTRGRNGERPIRAGPGKSVRRGVGEIKIASDKVGDRLTETHSESAGESDAEIIGIT